MHESWLTPNFSSLASEMKADKSLKTSGEAAQLLLRCWGGNDPVSKLLCQRESGDKVAAELCTSQARLLLFVVKEEG